MSTPRDKVLPILVERGAAEHGRDAHLGEAAIGAGALRDLACQLAGRSEHQHPAGAALRTLAEAASRSIEGA
jgi:hypothetical protein